jgi:osmotically-inducible protein OsmY
MKLFSKLALSAALACAAPMLTAGYASATPSNPDSALSMAVRAELNKDAALLADHLDVQTIHGVVYVRGTVDTAAEQDKAGAAAIKAAGGASVVNMTELAY